MNNKNGKERNVQNAELIRLRSSAIKFRERWLARIESPLHRVLSCEVAGENRRVFLVKEGWEWLDEFAEELESERAKIKRGLRKVYGTKKSKRHAILWMPELVRHCSRLASKIYPARASRLITTQEAREIAEEANVKLPTARKKYRISTESGNSYRLEVTTGTNSEIFKNYIPFPPWSVVGCIGKFTEDDFNLNVDFGEDDSSGIRSIDETYKQGVLVAAKGKTHLYVSGIARKIKVKDSIESDFLLPEEIDFSEKRRSVSKSVAVTPPGTSSRPSQTYDEWAIPPAPKAKDLGVRKKEKGQK